MPLWLYRFVNALACSIFLIFTPKTVIGKEHMPEEGGVLVVCNHLRFYDLFLLATCFKRRLVFMAKNEVFKYKTIGNWIRQYGAFPVDRDGSGMAAVRESVERLNRGEALVVFPEGTRSRGKEMGDFKEGATLIAAKAGCSILPMYINSRERQFTRIQINIGETFKLPRAQRINSAYLSESTQMIKEKVLSLRIDGFAGRLARRVE